MPCCGWVPHSRRTSRNWDPSRHGSSLISGDRIPGKRPAAAVKILLSDQQLNFTAEGDDSYIESVVKIQTPQGLGAMGTLTLAWNPATDTMIVHKVHIVRGDQVINVLEGNEPFTILRRENNLEYASLDGILTAVIQPPGLQVGDIVDMAVTLRRADPFLWAHPSRSWYCHRSSLSRMGRFARAGRVRRRCAGRPAMRCVT